MEFRPVKEYYEQFLYTLYSIPEAVRFTRKKKLWEGFWKYGWVSRLLLLLAVLAGLKFLSLLFDWFDQVEVDPSDPLQAAGTLSSFFTEVAAKEFEFLFAGGMKYVMLILLEIVIFHMCRRTFQILSKTDSDASLNAFIKAQVRMLKVALRSFILETFIVALINVATGIFDLLAPLGFIAAGAVKAYYVGFTVIDNYHEQFGLTIKESVQEARNYLGVVLALGLTLQVLFLIPLLGTILAPILAAVAATMVMYELSDLHKPVRQLSMEELV